MTKILTTVAELGHKILFLGSDSFAQPVLKNLHLHQKQNPAFISDLQVVTHFKSSKSKKITNQVEQYAVDNKISKVFITQQYTQLFILFLYQDMYQPIGQTPNNRKNEWLAFSQSDLFKNNSFNLGIVCSYGYMIPSYIIDKFSKGMLVIHPSLLPKYRGASPLQYALLNGDKQTGVSTIEISKLQFDAGKILRQSVFDIPQNFTYTDLSAALALQSSHDIIEVLQNYDENRKNGKEQNEDGYTKAPKFLNTDTHLNFEQEDFNQIYNRYRCFKGTNFVSEIIIDKMNLPVTDHEKEQLSKLSNSKPGSIWAFKQKSMKNFIYVKCREGYVRIDDWRFFDQNSKPAYTFTDQFIKREEMSQDYSKEGYVYFEKIQIDPSSQTEQK